MSFNLTMKRAESPEENKISLDSNDSVIQNSIKKMVELNIDLSSLNDSIPEQKVKIQNINLKKKTSKEVIPLKNVDINFGTIIPISLNKDQTKKYFITFISFKSKLIELSIKKFLKLFLKEKIFEKIVLEDILRIIKNESDKSILFKLKDVPVEAKKGNNPLFALNNNCNHFMNYWKSRPFLQFKFMKD